MERRRIINNALQPIVLHYIPELCRVSWYAFLAYREKRTCCLSIIFFFFFQFSPRKWKLFLNICAFYSAFFGWFSVCTRQVQFIWFILCGTMTGKEKQVMIIWPECCIKVQIYAQKNVPIWVKSTIPRVYALNLLNEWKI